MSGSRPHPHVDFEPLGQALSDRGVNLRAAGALAGIEWSGVYKAKNTNRITVWAADRLAIRALDRHPVEIYGDDWLDQDALRAGRIDAAFESLREVAS